jgi:hypothetical protein
MAAPVPEVIGAPSPQGVIIAQGNNRPGPQFNGGDNDSWYIPAHTPLFLSSTAKDRDGVCFVTADYRTVSRDDKVVGVSIDGLYDAKMQRDQQGSIGANRLSFAVGGLVTVASHRDDNKKFIYGDPVYIESTSKVERLQDTGFAGALRYDTVNRGVSLGTFVGPVGPEGGMKVMLNFDL